MKAYITSIGEPTTELCKWSVERHGFDVEVVEGPDSLAAKLEYIYKNANEDFIRVDADVVVTRYIKQLPEFSDVWWWSLKTFGMYSQSIIVGGVQFYSKEVLPILRQHYNEMYGQERPETYMYRLDSLHGPRRCDNYDLVVGIHGFGQKDMDRVKETKKRRNQYDNYDFELAERMAEFYV